MFSKKLFMTTLMKTVLAEKVFFFLKSCCKDPSLSQSLAFMLASASSLIPLQDN